MRLLTGLLAGVAFDSVLVGDPSLSLRPMERVADPLRAMGALISTTGGHAPLGEFEWADSYFALWRTVLAASIPAGIIGLLILKRTKA